MLAMPPLQLGPLLSFAFVTHDNCHTRPSSYISSFRYWRCFLSEPVTAFLSSEIRLLTSLPWFCSLPFHIGRTCEREWIPPIFLYHMNLSSLNHLCEHLASSVFLSGCKGFEKWEYMFYSVCSVTSSHAFWGSSSIFLFPSTAPQPWPQPGPQSPTAAPIPPPLSSDAQVLVEKFSFSNKIIPVETSPSSSKVGGNQDYSSHSWCMWVCHSLLDCKSDERKGGENGAG